MGGFVLSGAGAEAKNGERLNIDVLIQTFNEEVNLPHTLASVKDWANRVFIVDSGSTDRTMEIAREFGAVVVEHAWEGYARQKNWALDNLPFESEWILILDADEAVSSDLRLEIQQIVGKPASLVESNGFFINRVFIFMGTQIRHCGYFPSWNLRLFKKGKARYEDRMVHEHMLVDGKTGYLKHLLLHEDRRGLEHFFAKHNRYSTLEARELFDSPEPWPGLPRFFRDRVARRRFMKSRILPHLPLPWTWRLIYMYFIRFGFLDGKAGWVLSNFISGYEFFIQTKYKELKRLRGHLPFSGTGLSQAEGQLSQRDQIGVASRSAIAPEGAAASTVEFDIPMLAKVVPETPASVGVIEQAHAHAIRPRTTNLAPVSVVIPTLNEAQNLPRCLDHLQWADEVVVVDSGSTDDTVAIAEKYGAKVIQFKWNGAWPKKKNWTLRHAPLANKWVLIVDADEWITPDLAEEIKLAIKSETNVGYYINRKFIFMGRWIKHCGYYPSWNLRLIKRGYGEYEQLTGIGNTGSGDNEVHEHVIARGTVRSLDHDMLHFAFPNIHTFMEKHNRYSNWEAAVQFKRADTTSAAIGDVLSRRRRLKNLSRYLPFRPSLRFLYAYVWKGGWLDGQPGYVFCRLLAIYEYLSVSKYKELKRADADARSARQLSAVPALNWSKSVDPETTG
jgi:glycosyltransferase involved in cell wall biosynthesis